MKTCTIAGGREVGVVVVNDTVTEEEIRVLFGSNQTDELGRAGVNVATATITYSQRPGQIEGDASAVLWADLA